jgi:hypothetical protein
MNLEEVVARYREQLAPGAQAVVRAGIFDLTLPCVVISGGTVITTSIGALRGHLPCSVALASEAIQRFVLLQAEHGFDRAFEICSSDDTEGNGEDFVRNWDEAQRDLEEGVVVTVNDLVAMVGQAKEGWSDNPRRMLVVAREGSKVVSGTVSTDWTLAGV